MVFCLSISYVGDFGRASPYCPAPDVGLEPTTTSLKGWRSTDWANRANLFTIIYTMYTYYIHSVFLYCYCKLVIM